MQKSLVCTLLAGLLFCLGCGSGPRLVKYADFDPPAHPKAVFVSGGLKDCKNGTYTYEMTKRIENYLSSQGWTILESRKISSDEAAEINYYPCENITDREDANLCRQKKTYEAPAVIRYYDYVPYNPKDQVLRFDIYNYIDNMVAVSSSTRSSEYNVRYACVANKPCPNIKDKLTCRKKNCHKFMASALIQTLRDLGF